MSGSNTISKPLLLDKNHFLIGFMGTGKSHWGKLWAAANKLTFVDLDELIEKEEDSTSAEIFDTKIGVRTGHFGGHQPADFCAVLQSQYA